MPGSPLDRHDAVLLDLDGVVYRGDRVLPGVPEAVHAIRERVPILFLTNNSGRTPQDVADRLRAMGVPAQAEEVLTSALATAAMLRREGHSGLTAFVIGERGIREALAGAGVRIVDGHADRADLVVVGWDRTADYAKLRTAALLVQRGARLIATNPDTSYPAPDGLWPGAGALLAAVTTTTGADPQIVGKPMRPMFDAALEATGARDPLMVGDRLDTDVSGAAALGWETLLVFSGASGPRDLTSAEALPTYVGEGLPAVLEPRVAGRFRRAEPRDAASPETLPASELSSKRPGSGPAASKGASAGPCSARTPSEPVTSAWPRRPAWWTWTAPRSSARWRSGTTCGVRAWGPWP